MHPQTTLRCYDAINCKKQDTTIITPPIPVGKQLATLFNRKKKYFSKVILRHTINYLHFQEKKIQLTAIVTLLQRIPQSSNQLSRTSLTLSQFEPELITDS